MDIKEPEIMKDDVLILKDPDFNPENVCIVSGCATGIGRALAVCSSLNGLMTVGLDINEKEAEKTVKRVKELGGKMVFIKTDLTNDGDIINAVEKASQLGQIRFLANIAGIQHIDAIEDFPMGKYDLMQKIMLRAPFFLSKLTIPYMKRSRDECGVIGNMASVHAHICTIRKSVYNITKFGLRALTQSIAAEGEGKIRAFSVSTGFVRTPLALNQIPDQARQRGITPEEVVRDVMMGRSRVKEMMKPVDVANIFIFGFSYYAKYLIGGDLLFDGGMVLTY